MGILLLTELLGLVFLIYFTRMSVFLAIFIDVLRILSPVFLGVYAVFFIAIMFDRGRELTVKTWGEYLRELLRFFFVSLVITLAIIGLCALLGALLGLLLKKIYALPTVRAVIESLREWVATQFY